MTRATLEARIAEIHLLLARQGDPTDLKGKYRVEAMRERMAELQRRLSTLRWFATVARPASDWS